MNEGQGGATKERGKKEVKEKRRKGRESKEESKGQITNITNVVTYPDHKFLCCCFVQKISIKLGKFCKELKTCNWMMMMMR